MELQWPLILFTTLLAWSAGLFGTQAAYSLRGVGAKAQMPALICSVVLMAAGGIAVFFHLQHWERIFNGFGHLTSGITQELIAVVVTLAVMVVYFVHLRRSGSEARVPKWLAVAALVVSVVLVCVSGHSYMMASLPAWNSVLQIGSLLGAACALGTGTMAALCALKGEDDAVGAGSGSADSLSGPACVAGQVANAVLVVAYIAAMAASASAFTSVSYWIDPVSPTQEIVDATTLSPFAGDAVAFTVAAIVLALAGIAAAIAGKKRGGWKVWGSVAVAAALASALCLRVVFYQMGVSIYPFF